MGVGVGCQERVLSDGGGCLFVRGCVSGYLKKEDLRIGERC